MIEQRMQQIGTMNRSGFLRKMAQNGLCIVVDVKELREVTKRLCSMSNNMNQYAKKANATGIIYLEDIDSMKEKQSELMQIYGKVLSELEKYLLHLKSSLMSVDQFRKNCLGRARENSQQEAYVLHMHCLRS